MTYEEMDSARAVTATEFKDWDGFQDSLLAEKHINLLKSAKRTEDSNNGYGGYPRDAWWDTFDIAAALAFDVIDNVRRCGFVRKITKNGKKYFEYSADFHDVRTVEYL